MIPTLFTLKLVSESYKIPYKKVLSIAEELGLKGDKVTNDQAFDIANHNNKPKIEVIVVYKTTEIMPSRLNYTTLEDL